MIPDPSDTPAPDPEAEWGPIAGRSTPDSPEIPPGLHAAPAMPVNGHGAATPPTAAQQTAAGVAALVQLAAQLPQAIAVMLGQVARAIPRQHMCATCLIGRLKWEAQHAQQLTKAITDASAAAGVEPGTVNVDPAPFLPEHLRPGTGSQGMPPVNPAITTIGGTDFCAGHVPGQPGGRTLLIAQSPLSSSLLSQFAA